MKSKLYFVGCFAALWLAVSPVLFPCSFWHVLMFIDFWYPFIYTSPYVEKYHDFIMSRLPILPELPAIEVPHETATLESIRKASKGFTVPVVIRNVLKDIPAIKYWTNKSWWREHYGDEIVMVNSHYCLMD